MRRGLGAVTCLLMACPPNDEVQTTPPKGPAQFELARIKDRYFGGQRTTLWSKTLVPEATQAYGPTDLSPASSESFLPDVDPIEASVWSPDGEPGRPLEAQLFASDPEATAHALEGVVDPDTFLSALVTPANRLKYVNADGALLTGGVPTLPDAFVLPYPMVGAGQAPTATYLSADLFGQPAASAAPVAGGSVQTVRFVQNGLCARTLPFKQFTDFADQFLKASLEPNCSALTELGVSAVTIAPTLRHTEAPQGAGPSNAFDARGGFALNGAIAAKLNPFGHCQARFNAFYELELQGGLVHLKPTSRKTAGDDGAICSDTDLSWAAMFLPVLAGNLKFSGALSLLDFILSTQVPAAVDSVVAAQQWVPTLADVSCDLSTANAPTAQGDDDGCAVARNEFDEGLKLGAQALGLGATALQHLKDTSRRVEGGKYYNWACLPKPGKPEVGECRYALRARRLVVNPDDVRLVWFDNAHDFTNPARAAHVYLTGLASQSGLAAKPARVLLGQLCTPQGESSTFPRPFAVARTTPQFCR